MYLARREAGKVLRVYPLHTLEREPRAWIFDGRHPETTLPTSAAMNAHVFNGCAATGYTRGEAVTNLHTIEEQAIHA